MRYVLAAFAALLLAAAPAFAQSRPPQSSQPRATPATPQEEPPIDTEAVVVTASKVEQQLVNAPATVSVVTSDVIQSSPATNYAELLRLVPAMNITQTSARDFNINMRGATPTLSTSQLALIDGRSLYLDFFGFVAWDFAPASSSEVQQVEVIRGPAAAVWGAWALSGVVNLSTAAMSNRDSERGDGADDQRERIGGTLGRVPRRPHKGKTAYSREPLYRPRASGVSDASLSTRQVESRVGDVVRETVTVVDYSQEVWSSGPPTEDREHERIEGGVVPVEGDRSASITRADPEPCVPAWQWTIARDSWSAHPSSPCTPQAPLEFVRDAKRAWRVAKALNAKTSGGSPVHSPVIRIRAGDGRDTFWRVLLELPGRPSLNLHVGQSYPLVVKLSRQRAQAEGMSLVSLSVTLTAGPDDLAVEPLGPAGRTVLSDESYVAYVYMVKAKHRGNALPLHLTVFGLATDLPQVAHQATLSVSSFGVDLMQVLAVFAAICAFIYKDWERLRNVARRLAVVAGLRRSQKVKRPIGFRRTLLIPCAEA